jgi:DeoR family transcriptional regulator, aga operon transcriptional repressor
MTELRSIGREMIPAERQVLVLEFVRRRGATSIQKLAQAIGASQSTIRRDLDFLTDRGYLERTHGGAVLRPRLRTTFEPGSEIAAKVDLSAKRAIAAHAAEMVEPGQSIILDSSSTVYEAALRIANRDIELTAVTNDLRIAMELAAAPRIRLIVLGGQVRPQSFTLTGEPAETFAERLHADLAFIGIHSLAGGRLSDTSPEIAAIKRRLIAAARQVVVLADSSKFEDPAFCDVCHAREVHRIVTDDGLSPRHRKSIERLGIPLTIVDTVEDAA